MAGISARGSLGPGYVPQSTIDSLQIGGGLNGSSSSPANISYADTSAKNPALPPPPPTPVSQSDPGAIVGNSGGIPGGGGAAAPSTNMMQGLQNAGPSLDTTDAPNILSGPSPILRQGIGVRNPAPLTALSAIGLGKVY